MGEQESQNKTNEPEDGVGAPRESMSPVSSSVSARPEPGSAARTTEDSNVRAARVLGTYVLIAAVVFGFCIVIAALVIQGFPVLSPGGWYLVFLLVVFAAYLVYQRAGE